MFRRAPASEEPRFLKDLLQALRDSEESLAEDEIAAERIVIGVALGPAAEPASSEGDRFYSVHDDLSEIDTIRAELKLLRELSAEWKEAVRVDRERTALLPDYQVSLAA